MKNLLKYWAHITIIIFLVFAIYFVLEKSKDIAFESQNARFWEMQSIDTVKYSRDVAGQYLNDPSFDKTIEDQVKKIASTGATHIALGTPYDERFVPFLKRWVQISRRNGLKIWFRGNFSGWEEWFSYDRIGREEHKVLLAEFIKNNGNLFEDGDYFTSCTECENGGAGDPRLTGDIEGFRQFLIDEYQISKQEFRLIDKNVATNYFPMNYDVASLIMDQETTKALGGVVVIDHYVGTPEKTNDDVNILAEKSGGKIVIGEFGAPIPDIHGVMNNDQQADWIDKTFFLLSQNKNLIGINYWTAFGGSTTVWNYDGTERKAVEILRKYFSPKFIKGYIVDETGKPITNAEVKIDNEKLTTNKLGQFNFPVLETGSLTISKDGYYQQEAQNLPTEKPVRIILSKVNPDFWYNLQKLIYGGIISL